jgi:CHAT domain
VDSFERQAANAVANAQVSPRESIAEARRILAQTPDLRTRSICWHAIAFAESESGSIQVASRAIAAAVRFANEAGATDLAINATLTQSTILFESGETAAAETAILSAIDGASELLLARAQGQYALLLQRIGRTAEATTWFDRAVPSFRSSNDEFHLCRALTNRAVLLMYSNQFSDARHDLDEVLQRSTAIGFSGGVARAHQNLGCIDARIGNISSALQHLDTARDLCQSSGMSGASIEGDRCETLLLGGLYDDAVKSALASVELCREAGADADLGEAEIQLARAMLGSGRFLEAHDTAAAAATRFEKQERMKWATYANGIRHLALPQGNDWGAVGAQLRIDGWEQLGIRVDLIDALGAEQAEDFLTARRLLEKVASPTSNADLEMQLTALEAKIHLARFDDDRVSRWDTIDKAQQILADLSSTLGLELSVGLMTHHHSLVVAGLAPAWVADDPIETIRTVESLQVGLQQSFATSRPTAANQSGAELRALRASISAGTAEDPFDAARQVVFLERLVVGKDRANSSTHGSRYSVSFEEALHRPDLVVVYVVENGDNAVVHVVSGELRRRALVPGIVRDGADLVSLTSIAAIATKPSAATNLERLRNKLSTQWSHVLDCCDPVASIVIVPGPLGGFPWGLVEPFASRKYSIVSSLTWFVNAPEPRTPRKTILVQGPGLQSGGAEMEVLSEMYPEAVLLRGNAATVSAVLEAIGDTDLVHIGAHGEFRLDNPMLSAISLVDGPLFARDLLGLEQPPNTIVLASCSTGQGRTYSGGTLGFSSALLASGCSKVIAPHALVDDDVAAQVMVAFHALIIEGIEVAEALRRIRAHPQADSRWRRTASTFSVFG